MWKCSSCNLRNAVFRYRTQVDWKLKKRIVIQDVRGVVCCRKLFLVNYEWRSVDGRTRDQQLLQRLQGLHYLDRHQYFSSFISFFVLFFSLTLAFVARSGRWPLRSHACMHHYFNNSLHPCPIYQYSRSSISILILTLLVANSDDNTQVVRNHKTL